MFDTVANRYFHPWTNTKHKSSLIDQILCFFFFFAVGVYLSRWKLLIGSRWQKIVQSMEWSCSCELDDCHVTLCKNFTSVDLNFNFSQTALSITILQYIHEKYYNIKWKLLQSGTFLVKFFFSCHSENQIFTYHLHFSFLGYYE